ncbi:MAG: response regulator [Burkholderiaceae bacterium]
MRILLVDDDRLVRSTLAAGLTDRGHDVLDAESAEEALGLLGVRTVDIVISDIEMPGLGGLALGRALCTGIHRVRRVALTASQLSAADEAAMHELFERVLSKPITVDRLDSVLREFG